MSPSAETRSSRRGSGSIKSLRTLGALNTIQRNSGDEGSSSESDEMYENVTKKNLQHYAFDDEDEFHARHSSMDSSIQLGNSYHIKSNNPLYPQNPVAYTTHSQYSQYYAVPMHYQHMHHHGHVPHQRSVSRSLYLSSPHQNTSYAPITPMAQSQYYRTKQDAVIEDALPAIPGSVMGKCEHQHHSDAMSDVDDVFNTHKTLLHPDDMLIEERNESAFSYITDTSAVKQYKSDQFVD